MKLLCPFKLKEIAWPKVKFYKDQKKIIESVIENDETYVPAGNQLGKDFVAGFICIYWMMRTRPARCVTSSVKFDQLQDVLWGEIRNFLNSSKIDLPLVYNHMKIRQINDKGIYIDKGELVGQVVAQGEGLLGRHLAKLPNGDPTTLVVFDEASGMLDTSFNSCDTWAHRKLIIGNPYPTTNFFYRGVKRGDIQRPNGKGYESKVIKIRAEDSPNVRLAQAEIAAGKEPSNTILVPGVKDYQLYMKHRRVWDAIKQTIQLDARFYEGAEHLMFPTESLDACEKYHVYMNDILGARVPKAIGVDPAEGGDNSCWALIDEYGLLDLIRAKTEETTQIQDITKQLIHSYDIDPSLVAFDRGGGVQHADALRRDGYDVETIAFGGSASLTETERLLTREEMQKNREQEYTFLDKRSEMYWGLRDLILTGEFGLPEELVNNPGGSDRKSLRGQLAPIPMLTDKEGRIYIPPKQIKGSRLEREQRMGNSLTLRDLIGHSPDEADSVVLAREVLHRDPLTIVIGAA